MPEAHREQGKPAARKPGSFMRRLQEIDLFFEKRGKEHQTMRRLAKRLEKAGIPYAIAGAMAVNAHDAERTTKDVDVLLTQDGLEQFRQRFVGKTYESVQGRSRRFTERQSGVQVDVLETGRYPGFRGAGPFPFPHPDEASETIENVRVVTLPQLVQLKLAARRYSDFGDVCLLIRVQNLDESFLDKIHPSVRQDFIECLEETRRQIEYEAREGL